jgi:hypothetical protein
MSSDSRVVIAELERIITVLDGIHQRMSRTREEDLPRIGRTELTAVFIAQLFDNFYTAVETLFLRISQFFENTLSRERWHSDLLDKMTLHVNGVRPRIIREDTNKLLHELMRFRHFKRYYLELEYDWTKLDYLLEVYDRVRPLVERDLSEFKGFLGKLDG